jgi:hypothetical protein
MYSGMWGTIKVVNRVREELHGENSAWVLGSLNNGFIGRERERERKRELYVLILLISFAHLFLLNPHQDY